MLPDWRSSALNKRDQAINKVDPSRLIELYKTGKLVSMIDRGMAINAARKGVPVGFFPTAMTMLFPIALIAIIALPFFVDWWYSFGAFVAAVLIFRWSRGLTARAVRNRALRDPEILCALMKAGVCWFQAKGSAVDLVVDLPKKESKIEEEEVLHDLASVKPQQNIAAKPSISIQQPESLMEVPKPELLHRMTEEELRDVWEARPLVQWGVEFQALSQDERWDYFKNHSEMAFWEMPIEFLHRVQARIQQEELSSGGADATEAFGNTFYEVQGSNKSKEFLAALARAKAHLDSCVQDGTVPWLLSAREGPSIHHLGFRIGNQLFLGQLVVEGSQNQDFDANREALLLLCENSNAHPFVMPLQSVGGSWNVIERNWGLLHAKTLEALDPFPLVSAASTEMSDFELQDFAVQIVVKELEKKGRRLTSAQSSPDLNPSIWFEDEDGLAWVCVRASRYPASNPVKPRNMKFISDKLENHSVGGYFASVGVANANAPFIPNRPQSAYPLRRGEGLVVRYSGLDKIN